MSYIHRYLTNYLPSPSTIPVTVSLSVPERKFLASEVVLRPDDNMAAVLRKLRLAMEERGMMVAEFPACEEFTISIIRCEYSHASLTFSRVFIILPHVHKFYRLCV